LGQRGNGEKIGVKIEKGYGNGQDGVTKKEDNGKEDKTAG